ncbi:MAG: hypothetical protein QOI98_2218 [Solirubrobacteraceae bacterium]|nr:hypothetical protein [Solirubrobacteraceae bacterium]
MAAMSGRVAEVFLALLVPPACASCSASVAPGAVLCAPCRSALPWLGGPRCERCGQPAPCAPCPARSAAFDRAWAPLEHRGPARALQHALKFRGALACAEEMAAQIAQSLPGDLVAGATLVPVPRHPARRRRRGFDQAHLLALALGRATGRPVRACLDRLGPDRPQVGTRRAVRLERDRISVRARGSVPQTAVLVDDVHTTGATLDACASALRVAGAANVVAVTYTRALA